MIRVADDVVQALRMFAGEIQAESGSPTTDSDAVRALLKTVRPELLQKVQEKSTKKKTGKLTSE